MFPILFKIGSFPIRTFGLTVLGAVLLASSWLGRALRRHGITDEDALGDLLTRCVLYGFLGARLLYLLVHPEDYHDPISLIALWEGGIVSYGGFLGGAFGAWTFARKRRISYVPLLDTLAPALALGQFVGRIGCLLVGDDHGKPWDGPWAITFPAREESLIPPELVGVPLHPSQIYLSLMNLALFFVLARVLASRRFDGQVIAVGMALYAVGRFALEFTRGDYAARGIYGALSTAQWVSLAVFAGGAWLYARGRPRSPAVA